MNNELISTSRGLRGNIMECCGKCIYYEKKNDNIKARCREGHFVRDSEPEDECECEDFFSEDEV